ncbi:MAG: hypothetical protein M3008_09555 [Chloroflexota bacterium]|nr:hypothetical protein [Chloroflexota bacterium]
MAMTVEFRPKQARKPQQRTLPLMAAIGAIAEEYERMTIRQLYYQLVSRRVIEKTEAEYKRVCDISAQMRIAGTLPYGKIADGNRQRRRVAQWDGPADLLETATKQYRKDRWQTQEEIVEVWCEKDALSGVLLPVCEEWGVTYVATRGNPSMTLIYESAAYLDSCDQWPTILYVGDHDASGRGISDRLGEQFHQHTQYMTVERIALEPEQIEEYSLPTRPGKKSDMQYQKFADAFGDASVEVDALPPDVLTEIVENAIVAHIDLDKWDMAGYAERAEKQSLIDFTANLSALGIDPSTEILRTSPKKGLNDG